MSPIAPAARAAIERATPLLARVVRETRLLDSIAWPRGVEEAFVAAGGEALPKPTYRIDRARAEANVRDLEDLVAGFDAGEPVSAWLARVAASYRDGARLLLAVGTPEFHRLSREIYGGPSSPFDHDTSNLDLANHLQARLAGEAKVIAAAPAPRRKKTTTPDAERLDARAFADALVARARAAGIALTARLDPDLSAKVVAGTERIRVREGTFFRPAEVEGLFVHEVETHALTAQNGAAQPHLPFLKSGGPRSTRTQEGLAVFAEFHARALSVSRMHRIVRRVRLVAMAEDGADFLDLHRALLEDGETPRDAYLDAQRICRGGLVTGRAPFTKDAAYLAGFTEIYNFLQVAVRGGARDALELLICGRIALDDLAILDDLRDEGLLARPALVPRWLADWEGLLPYFAFTSFLQEIDLREVEARHREVLAAAQDRVEQEGR
jgi:uncharacterized protein (TIGR02421 family)